MVFEALRRRAYRGGQLDTGSVRVTLTGEQRRQVARMLGTDWEVSGRQVNVRVLNASLAEHGLTVRQFIEALDGRPLPVRRDEVAEQEREEAAEQEFTVRTLCAAGVSEPVVRSWLAGSGAPRLGTGKAADLATEVAAVWPRLPWSGPPMRLAQLAAAATDNAHALDHSTDLGRTTARLIAATTGIAGPRRPGREWRAAWKSAGIRCDTVSSRVLTLNLPLDITAGHRPGAPAWLTLRDLLGPWSFDPVPDRLYVCENPTIVESAADELGPTCPPLICTDGVPALAALDLVAAAADHHIDIRVRADIDRTGLIIVSALRSVAPHVSPWRFDTHTYTTYFDLGTSESPLAEIYERHGRDLHEEAILPQLLDDLRATP
ncbi:TIGR02679 domain-containing protein [Nocardia macrotermitis]|uniref:DUF2399 domain-containing protein n=1 Tax=Nocardia macrotermitis TaxID=2585198 RepID=A0A7K0D308_9NOCA|nr:TIGR02679 domain-containing protein [Nocardia macrotermitis]MQY20110.1 hypothetical protein [Nocardia macrotermitis]